MSAQASFAEVGDMVVIPAVNVGVIEAIETMTVGEVTGRFFRVLLPSGMRNWLPVDSMAEKGVRRIMSRETAEELFGVIADQEAPAKRANWNRRQRRYQQTLLDNRPQELGALLGELAAVQKRNGPLSPREAEIYRRVERLLVAELSQALGLDEIAAQARLEQAIAA
jgi:CarD family transcriptional regulator